MIFFSYLTDFSYFSVKKEIPKIAGQSEQVKNDPFERGINGLTDKTN
jgi:hypothetical protein